MGKLVALTGNAATAEAMRQVHPHVVAAYPITPQTDVVEEFASFVASGRVNTEYVPVESEHSAMSTCIGAAAAGTRVMTATSSQGLALMWEMLYIASGLRLPIVMANVNRALSAPLNIHCDHSDSMGARDSGWVQIYCKTAQEAYDTVFQAVRIAERDEVRLPVMVCYDGYLVSHSIQPVQLIEDDQAQAFIGPFVAKDALLNSKQPVTYGPLFLFDYYFESKRQGIEAMKYAKPAVVEAGKAYGELSGRYYDLLEPYRLDDAEIGIIVMNSAASTAEVAVDNLRAKGLRVGSLRLRCFRPFPEEELLEAVKHLKGIAVLDRATSPGQMGGPVGVEVRAALMSLDHRPVYLNGIYGLGGRDTTVEHIESAFEQLGEATQAGRVADPVFYLGLRGGAANGVAQLKATI